MLFGLTLGGGMAQACADHDGSADESIGGGGAAYGGDSGTGGTATAGRGGQDGGAPQAPQMMRLNLKMWRDSPREYPGSASEVRGWLEAGAPTD